MTCERFAELLDHVEWNDPLPPVLVSHAAECPRCAALASAVADSVRAYRTVTAPDEFLAADIIGQVMAALPHEEAPRRLVSMKEWLVTGAVLVASMVMVPLLAGFRALTSALGSDFTLPLAVVLGSLLTVYSVMFVFSHLEEFSRLLPGLSRRTGHEALV